MNEELPEYELKIVRAGTNKGELVEIYKATLEFLGKIFVPAVILVAALAYREEVGKALEGLKLSKVDTPLFSAEFAAEVLDGLANPDPDSEERRSALRKIETGVEVVRAELDAGTRREIPTQGIPASESSDIKTPSPGPEWETVLGISWVKPNDLFGRTYFLSAGDGLYVWPTDIDSEGNRAEILVNTSSSSRRDGNTILQPTWIQEGKDQVFDYSGRQYRLNLIDIRNAGKIPSQAAFISVDRRVDA